MVLDLDFAARYRAVQSRDPRFDGRFFTGVTSTGIYCRPSCPATTPQVEHVRFYPTAAAAQEAGFRACKRCIPGAVPGSPAWDLVADVAGRAMRLIADGVVDREGVPGLARHLGYSDRQVRRHLRADLGAGPLALARAQRAHVARLLLETTDLPVTEVAFAAGFGSLRQFNATITEVFALAPTALREARRPGEAAPSGRIVLRLARRAPFAWPELLRFLAVRAVPGVEEVVDGDLPPQPSASARAGDRGAGRRRRHGSVRAGPGRPARPRAGRGAVPSPARPGRRSRRRGRDAGRAAVPRRSRSRERPAGARPARPTLPNWRSGPCWGRGSRSPRPGRSRAVSWKRTGRPCRRPRAR